MSDTSAPAPFRPDTQSARSRIFGRIRSAQGRSSTPGASESAASAQELAQARARMADHTRGPQPLPLSDSVAVFVERALALSCTVDRVAGTAQVGGAVADYLRSNNLPAQLVMWPSLADSPWLTTLAERGVAVRIGAPRGEDLVGLSSVHAAVAETATLVLASSPQTPASTHLLPETHIAVLRAADIVPTLEDVFDQRRAANLPMPRALNLVSGPSRTGDIEQTIVLGAHGPYRVHLVIVDAP